MTLLPWSTHYRLLPAALSLTLTCGCDVFTKRSSGGTATDNKPGATPATISAPSYSGSSVTLSSASVAASSGVTVTLTLKNGAGVVQAISGKSVGFQMGSSGTSYGTFGSVTDHSNGTYSAVFTGVAGGSARNIQAYLSNEGVFSSQPTVSVVGPPTSFTYSTVSATYTKNSAITSNTASYLGGVTLFSTSPAMPAGLTLNVLSGTISGTPTASQTATAYTITGYGVYSNATKSITIAVNGLAPVSLAYSQNSVTYTRLTAITSITASISSGDSPTTYAVTGGTLPTGLSLNTSSGLISGTPSVTAQTAVTIVGSNSWGASTAAVTMRVNARAPSEFNYGTNSYVWYTGTTVPTSSPSLLGAATADAATSWVVAPTLPTGVTYNTSNGTITGLPTAAAAVTNYVFTAINSGGTATRNVQIEIRADPPTSLSYAAWNGVTINRYSALTSNSAIVGPTSTSITLWSISPTLPSGVTMSLVTGTISGTPTVISSSSVYVVTASNSGGTVTAPITMEVLPMRPNISSYTLSAATYTRMSAITSNSPTMSSAPTGDPATGFVVSPTLPTGLSLDPTSGVISGTPSVTQGTSTYTITPSNTGGSDLTPYNLSIRVNAIAPSSLTYSDMTPIYTWNSAIATNSPSLGGGDAVTGYAVSPSLPTGLSINTANGQITGTPSVTNAGTNYAVTGTNSGGSTAVTVNITINPVALSALSYTSDDVVYLYNTSITSNVASYSGGPVTGWTISPALPTGLTMSTSTGTISGTPTGTTSYTGHTITAGNTLGTTTAGVTIEVWRNTVSATFDGTDDYAPTGTDLQTILGSSSLNAFTVSFWMYANSMSANDGVLGGTDSAIFGSGFGLQLTAANKIRFWVNDSANYAESAALATGTWYHVVGVFDNALGSNNIRLYINGAASGTGANYVTALSTGMSAPFEMGRVYDNTTNFDGILDDVSLWNTGLSSSAISSVYNSGKPRKLTVSFGSYSQTANLKGWWRMLGTFPTLTDEANSNNATATNMAAGAITSTVP